MMDEVEYKSIIDGLSQEVDRMTNKFRHMSRVASYRYSELQQSQAREKALREALVACRGYVPGVMLPNDTGQCARCGRRNTASGRLKYCPKCALELADEALAGEGGAE